MAWFYLLIAACFEVSWAVGIKLSDGFTKPFISGFTIVAMILSMVFLIIAVRDLPIGTAYAVWTGLGAAGVAIIGMAVLGEPVIMLRLLSIGLIIAGIVGLKLTSSA